MATIDSLISKENFSTSWAKNWSDQHGNKGQVRYVYICAPAWYMLCDCWYYAFGGSGQFTTEVAYWNGSQWVVSRSIYHNGADSTNGITRYYGHNHNEGGSYYSGDFSNDYPLWRIKYWPARGNTRWKITLWAGGWGVAKNTSSGAFLNYPQGKPIRSRGRTGDPIHASGTTEDTTNVLNNIFNPNNRRGSPILASIDSELVSYPYL